MRQLIVILSLWFSATIVAGQTCRLFSTDNGLTTSLVNYILEDRYGQIWIATEDGLNRYDGVKISSYKHKVGDDTSLASNYVSTLVEDAQGNLIVSTYTGLQIYRHDTDDFSPLGSFSDGTVMKANISDFLLEHDGRLFGAGDLDCEIIVHDKEHIEIVRLEQPYFSIPRYEDLPRELNVRTTLRYDASRLLLGSDGYGVKLYDEMEHTYSDYPLDIPGIPQNLQKVHHMMRDRKGNIWLALYQKGVVMVSQRKSMFGYIGNKSSQQNLIGSHCVQSIFRNSKGGMWVGTDGDGLYYLEGNKSQHFTDGIPPIINTVLEDSEGTAWIGSFGHPCYKRENGVFRKVELPDNPRIFCLREDNQHDVWLGSMGLGLFRYSRSSKSIEHIDYPDMSPFVNCIHILSNGEVLAGSFNGLFNITRQQAIVEKRIVYAIYEDIKGRLWLGSSDGLVVIDKGEQKVFTTADGMPSNTVFAINEDQTGNLWFSSNSGLSCFDENEGVFTNYSVRDGLQGNEFSKGAVHKDKDGTLWFAGHEGITYFSARNISQQKYNLHPRITALYINNVAVNTKTLTEGEAVIDTTLYECSRFRIAYEDNSFSIELAAAEIDCPSECTYCYNMDGEGWVTIPDGGHIVSFSNLAAGIHTFQYAVEYNGNRSDIKQVSIQMLHPWWSSIWIKCILLLGILAFFALLFFWIRSKEKVKALALISHKIRTPMSLIISPLVQLIDTDPDEQRQKTYKLMLRNAEKLQHLAAQATEEEPIGPIAQVKSDDDTATDMQQSRTTRQIVIVEDDDEVRRYLCEQLSSDYHVREATNGKDALDLIYQKMPDAIISDITMPQMDGITLCRKLKKNINLAHIPVILLTARADEESTLQGLGIGADAYITKPFNIRILRQKVNNLIQLRLQLKNTYQDQLLQEDKQEEPKAIDYDDLFMQRLMNCINKHISEKDFSIEMICDEVGISRSQLHRRLKEKTNQSTSIFLRNVRLYQAEKLLRESNMRITEIADQVGFSQLNYFSNSFKELYGVSPSEYREKKN